MTSRLFALLALSAALAVPAFAHAEDATPPAVSSTTVVSETLLSGLGRHATSLEEMKKRGAFTFSGHMESVDGDGKASEVKDLTIRSTPSNGGQRVVKVMRYVEDGKDKTVEAQTKADARRAKNKESKGDKKVKELKLPFLPTEQARYNFSVAQRDAANPSRILLAFTPKVAAEDAVKGTAWVDESAKEILSTGFSFSKNPTFVDHVNITIVFGLSTPLGRAPSQISFDGQGGFLFLRKHYRGSANISDPAIAF